MSKLHMIKGTIKRDAITESTVDDSLIVPMRIAQVGVRDYIMEDSETWELYTQREAFLPEHLFKQDTLDSAKGLIATHYHPWSMINSGNWDFHMKGVTMGEAKVADNKFIEMDVKVFDTTMKAYILSGISDGVSMGYYCTEVKEPGEINGESYDVYVKDISFNHLAFCAREDARGGVELGAKLDSIDIKELPDITNVILDKDLGYKTSFLEEVQKFRRDTKIKSEVNTMRQVRLDGKTYEVPDAIGARLDSLAQDNTDIKANAAEVQTKLDTAEAAKTDLQKKYDTVEGERDGLQEKVTGLETEKSDLQAKLDAAPKEEEIVAKINLANEVSQITGKEVDIKLDTVEMHKQALETLSEGINLEGKSADYIAARYDMAKENAEAEGYPVVTKRADTEEDPEEKDQGVLRVDANGHAANHFSRAK